ncbi:MAG: ArsR/SmtB family transcription factor [Actinomycetes bacterium]
MAEVVSAGAVSDAGVRRAADLFRALGTPARVAILRLLAAPSSVSRLVEQTGLSQPLVSQHLRVLRGAGVVRVERNGREAIYSVTDAHITHVVEDAVAHALETPPDRPR